MSKSNLNVVSLNTNNPSSTGIDYKSPKRDTQPPPGAVSPEGACLREITQELVKYYYTLFEQTYGYKPEFSWGKACVFFERMANNFGKEKSQWVIQSFLESPPKWNRENFALDPWHVVGAINKIMLREENPW